MESAQVGMTVGVECVTGSQWKPHGCSVLNDLIHFVPSIRDRITPCVIQPWLDSRKLLKTGLTFYYSMHSDKLAIPDSYSKQEVKKDDTAKSSAHATRHDPELRAQLVHMVHELDRRVGVCWSDDKARLGHSGPLCSYEAMRFGW